VTAKAGTATGTDTGFVVLKRGNDVRRIPYDFFVARPGLASQTAVPLKTLQSGDTRKGKNLATIYQWPAAPFGLPPNPSALPMIESGKEHLYVMSVSKPTVNFGVAIVSESAGSLIDPWMLGAPDENTVQGYAGTPVNVNGTMVDYKGDIGVAGTVFASAGKFYVSVDSNRDPFTKKALDGRYVLRSWVNDLRPPKVTVLTTKVAAGRPTIALHVTDSQSGVDPFSALLAYGNNLIGAAAFDPRSGTLIFPIPAEASALPPGRPTVLLVVSDNQESKNVNTIGANALPNTTIKAAKLQVVNGPAITWIAPQAGACAVKKERLVVLASDSRKITAVTFFDGARKVATVKRGVADLFAADWKTNGLARGHHTLRATVTDGSGAKATAARVVRVC
jgi:hypothetical protein